MNRSPKKDTEEKVLMNTIEMPGITLHYLVKKWNEEWAGGYIQQMRAVHEDTFLIKIHTKNGNVELLVALPHIVLVSKRKWENAEEQPAVVNATKKLLDNVRVERVEQLGQDRIFMLRGESVHVIFELFGGGNVIITNEKGIIQFVHRAKEWKGRVLKMREKYLPPQNETKTNSSYEDEMKMKPVGFELAEGKNRLRLQAVFDKKAAREDLPSIFEKIEEKIIEEWKQPKVDSKREAQKQALHVNAARQRELLKEWEEKIAAQQAAGEWVYENFAVVQQLIDAVQRGMKAKVSEKMMLEEIRKKIPFVKKIDAKNGTIEIESNK